MNSKESILPPIACYGEILWDSMPLGLFIGGAPFNVAYHLTRLGQPSLLISGVGRDELGRQAIQKAEDYGMDVSCIQISDTFPTGVSDISIDESKNASYNIRQPAAWDSLSYTKLLNGKLVDCPALVFGTLASRSRISRHTLLNILDNYQGLTVCDVNLRKPHDDRTKALEIASRAQVIKLNEEELYALSGTKCDTASLEEALMKLRERINPSMVFLTRGGDPAVYFDGTRTIYAKPPQSHNVIDTVGAGDAFTAALVYNLLQNVEIEECLNTAIRLGSFIASKQGAQPDYDPSQLETGIPI